MSQYHVKEHIDLIAKHEQDFLAQRTHTERLGDAIGSFAGSFRFVVLQIVVSGTWVALNTLRIAGVRTFDPPPFSLLGTILALEAILLSSFILMRQSRVARRSDERDHLMLQILLLAEKEITAVVNMDRQMAEKMGLPAVMRDREIEQLGRNLSIDDVAQTIKENLPSE